MGDRSATVGPPATAMSVENSSDGEEAAVEAEEAEEAAVEEDDSNLCDEHKKYAKNEPFPL